MQGKKVMMVVILGVAGWLVLPLLARVQQPGGEAADSLPEGNGQALVSASCVGCHSLETSVNRGRSREEWVTTINDMVSRGAQISPEDADTITDYLAEHYGVDFRLPPEQRLMVWVDHQGNVEPLAAPPRNYNRQRLSPDGRRVAVDILLVTWDIWIYEIPTGELRRLTQVGNNRSPTWSNDGQWVAFGSDRHKPPGEGLSYGDDHEAYWKRADGSGEAERLTDAEFNHGAGAWTPDGKTLAISELHPETGRDLWMLPFEGDRKPWPYRTTPHMEGGTAFSADGRWLAYTSGETGQREVVIGAFPEAKSVHQVSTSGGIEVIWPSHSKDLFYRSGNKRMAVEISTSPTLTVGTPRVLFEGDFIRSPGGRAYWDATRDGQRFLMLKKVE
ncbi:MAG: hypothetical protein V3R94_02520 [Acidobacteriota bacterium]